MLLQAEGRGARAQRKDAFVLWRRRGRRRRRMSRNSSTMEEKRYEEEEEEKKRRKRRKRRRRMRVRPHPFPCWCSPTTQVSHFILGYLF